MDSQQEPHSAQSKPKVDPGADLYEVKKHKCPACQAYHNAATDMDGSNPRPPGPGDVTVCFNCGEILMFNKDMDAEKVSEDTWNKLPPTFKDTLTKIQALIRT